MENSSSRFRRSHLLTICTGYSPLKGSLSAYLQNYFAANRACGSKDRRQLRETLFSIWRRLPALLLMLQKGSNSLVPWEIVAIQEREKLWESVISLFEKLSDSRQEEASLNLDFLSLPEPLYHKLLQEFIDLLGDRRAAEERMQEIVLPQLNCPQIDLRNNPLKGTREKLLQDLPESWHARAITGLPDGISIDPSESERSQIRLHPLFQEGFFEIQDRGSQWTMLSLPAIGAQTKILDYCAGSGGKSLALLGALKKSTHQGQSAEGILDFSERLSLFDIRDCALQQAKLRLQRAGCKANLVTSGKPQGTYDLLLIDAPCSGSGTWRRQSELKWIFDPCRIEQQVATNRLLFQQACQLTRKGADILYITCSIFPSENELFIASQLHTQEIDLISERRIDPTSHNDGFYVAHFKKL